MFLFQERIDGIVQACEAFVQSGHFDADNIKSKAEQVLERYQQLSVSSCVLLYHKNILKCVLLIIILILRIFTFRCQNIMCQSVVSYKFINIINIYTSFCSLLKVVGV